jgi:hypothetical protein
MLLFNSYKNNGLSYTYSIYLEIGYRYQNYSWWHLKTQEPSYPQTNPIQCPLWS